VNTRITTHFLAAFLAAAGMGSPAHAQSTYGGASLLAVPVVARTASYDSTLFLFGAASNVTMAATYVGADGTTYAGPHACNSVAVAAGATVSTTVGALCPGLPAGSQFGMLLLTDISPTPQPQRVTAYSRVQTPGGDGFSIEGFPVWTFDSNTTHVTGLRRAAAAPGYQANCFVGSVGEAVSGTLTLYDAAGVPSAPLAFSLGANQLIRYLDVFAAVGLPAGDYSNYRATFAPTTPLGPALLAFCTLQNNTSFDADFRVAKSFPNGIDLAQIPSFVASGTTGSFPSDRLVYQFILRNPDLVSCELQPQTGGGESRPITDLELRLLDPTGNPIAGGNNLQSFAKVTVPGRGSTNGLINAWTVEIEGTLGDASGNAYQFFLTCVTGNGTTYLQLISQNQPRTF
jgi:hypothetical protein